MDAVGTELGHPQAPEVTPRSHLTLEPLRTSGPDILDVSGLPRIKKITLREIEITWETEFHEVTIRKADDLFKSAAARGPSSDPIPAYGYLTRAVFEIEFADSSDPQTIEIRPPNLIKLSLGCDPEALEPWFARCGFRTIQKLSHALLLLALAILTAVAPVCDDDDDDDDDDDGDPLISRLHHHPPHNHHASRFRF